MPERSLRFSVRDNSGHRAATWKLVTTTGRGKHDVYLACRSLGGALKTSLHQSGSWHVGYLRSFAQANLPPDDPKREDPYLDRWPRPAEIANGVTLAYRIVVPTSGVTVPIGAMLPPSVIWIPAAPAGRAVEIAVLFTSPVAVIDGWPSRGSMSTELVGGLALDNDETVWVVHRAIDFPVVDLSSLGRMSWYEGKGPADLSGGDIRAIVFGDSEDGLRFIVDCAVHPGERAI